MKRWTLGSGMLVTSSVLFGGFVAAGGLSNQLSPEGQIPQDVENLYSNLLEQAQTDARRDRLPQAVNTIAGIPRNSRHDATAQQLRERWSKDLLRVARNHYAQAQLKEALALLQAIPESSSVHAQAKNLQANWSSQSRQLEQADAAYGDRNWSQALRLLEPLKNTDLYTSPHIQTILHQSIDAAFDPGLAATDLSTTDKLLPAQLSAKAPSPVQLEAEPAPNLSPIAINVDTAMTVSTPPEPPESRTSTTASATPATRSRPPAQTIPAVAPAESLPPELSPNPTESDPLPPQTVSPELNSTAPIEIPTEPPVVPSQPEIHEAACQPTPTAQAAPSSSEGVTHSHDRKRDLIATAHSEVHSDSQQLITIKSLHGKVKQTKASCH